MERRLILLIMVVIVALVANPAVAKCSRWHLNQGGSYGIYDFSWGEINELNQAFESWTKQIGIDEFEIDTLDDNPLLFSFGQKVEVTPRWEIGLDLSILGTNSISESAEKEVPLSGGGYKFTSVDYTFTPVLAIGDLIVYYKCEGRLSPFLGVGIGYCAVNIQGDYNVCQETFTPPYGYSFKSLDESFSISENKSGWVLSAGLNWMVMKSVFDVRTGLEVRYHQFPKMEGQFEIENEGFSSFPVEPQPFRLELSGFEYRIYTMVRF